MFPPCFVLASVMFVAYVFFLFLVSVCGGVCKKTSYARARACRVLVFTPLRCHKLLEPVLFLGKRDPASTWFMRLVFVVRAASCWFRCCIEYDSYHAVGAVSHLRARRGVCLIAVCHLKNYTLTARKGCGMHSATRDKARHLHSVVTHFHQFRCKII